MNSNQELRAEDFLNRIVNDSHSTENQLNKQEDINDKLKRKC